MLASLVGDDIGIVRQLLQMSALHHLRDGDADVEVAEFIVLIAKFIDRLQRHRIGEFGHDKQNKDLDVQHILNKTVLFHACHLVGKHFCDAFSIAKKS